jgi:UV DNA damage endonuclease
MDNLSIEDATEKALLTWDREPLFHISSPINGWEGLHTNRHHDFIDIKDFPKCWLNLKNVTIEVEAKAKEVAIKKLQQELSTLK